MASLYKQKQKRKLIAAIVCCVLVFAMIVSTIVIGLVHKASLYEQFEDGDFAAAIAESLGLSSRYSLKQEDLDRFEGLVYFCNVGIDTANGYASYAYPVVMLCDKAYTDALIEQSDPDYEAPETEDDTDYSENIVAVPYVLSDPTDLNMFRNLRLLRAFDVSELNEMSQNCYNTQLYNMYGLGTTAYNAETLIQATKLSALTSLDQIASLTKLEQLSLCYTGITDLNGIENFPNLQKLDTTYTALEDISALKHATNLTYLSINSINVTETEDEHDHDHDHESEDESEDTSADESADTSADTSDESAEESEESEEEKEVPTYNETGLTDEDLAVLSNLTKLEYLDITNNNISDLSALSSLDSIKYLSVANNPLTSLKGAEGLKNMKVLYAIDCRLENLDAVKGFDKLETVYLTNNLLTDLSALSSATKVTYLDAADNELTDASAVAGMTELESLVLNGNKLTAAPDLSKLNKVTSVNLSKNEITDVSGLEKFDPTDFEPEKDEKGEDKELDVTITLNLSDNKIQNIKLTASLLTGLDLSENDLTAAALSFEGCKKLSSLTLNKNEKLVSLDGIEKLEALATLNAEETGVMTVPSLEKLEKLATVNLSKSQLTDLSAFKNNQSIKTLTLKECEKLTDISVLSTIKELTTVDFTKSEALTNESIAKAFGTPKDGDKKAELIFDSKSKLTVTLTGCKGITDFKIFDEYGNMKVTYDKKSETK